jgi:hypothetical protein
MINLSQLTSATLRQNNFLKSVIVYGRAGKQAQMAATLNMAKAAYHPYARSTGPVSSYPRILPKPDIPSLTPLIVASAF